MDSSQNQVKQVSEALNRFLQAGGSGNSSELSSKLQELFILIKNGDKSLVQLIPLEPLVASLDVYGWNSEVCRAVYGLIDLIIQTSDFISLVEQYESALAAAARNPDPEIAMLAVEALKLGVVDEALHEKLVQSEFFPILIKRIATPDMNLSDAVYETILNSNLFVKYSNLIEGLLQEAAAEKGIDEAMIRVLEVLCSLRKQVPNSSTIFNGLDAYIQSPDLLLQLCAFQIVIQNANNLHDYSLLSIDGGILDYLVARLPEPNGFFVNDEPIYCKTFTLISNLLRVKETDWSKYSSKLLVSLNVCLNESGESKKDALFTVGCMLSNNSLKKEFDEVEQSYLEQFTNTDPSVRAACFASVSSIFELDTDDQIKDLILTNGLGSFENFVQSCTSSVDELKAAAYSALKSILQHRKYAAQAMSSTLYSFLVNRDADDSVVGSRCKYDIISSLMKQTWINEVLNEPMLEAFTKYLSQGIYFSQSKPQVATESH